MMKKFGRNLLTAVLLSSLIVTPVMANPSVDDLKKEKETAQSEVSSLKSQLTEILNKMSQLEEDLIAKGQEIVQAEEDLAEAEELEKKQYADMKLRIKYMYEEGDSSFLETLMTAESYSDLVNKSEYVQKVHDYDREKLQEYVETKQKVADLKTTLETEQKDMESMQAEYQTEEDNLNTMLASKQAEIADLDEQIQEAAEAAAREEAARQAAAANSGNNGTSGGGSGSSSSGSGTVSPGNTATAQKIVSTAYAQLDIPYVWGGDDRSGFDCSGLVMYCHRAAGISLAHSSGAQGGGGQRVTSPQPGDVVWWPGHVGIYIGGGQMIHAPHTGDVVKISSVSSHGGTPTYRRYW